MPFIPLGQFVDPIRRGAAINAKQIRGGLITAQEIIIGGGTDGVIRSQNFDPTGPTGWAIFGDGSATFGSTVTIGGDIISGNWDGSNPADLSSGADGAATAGYYLDASAGAIQLEGSLYVGGDILLDGGKFRSVADTNNSYLELDTAINNVVFNFYGNPNIHQGLIGLDSGNMIISTDEADVTAGSQIRLEAEHSIVLFGAHDGTTQSAVIIGGGDTTSYPDYLLKVNDDALGGQGGGFVVQNANTAAAPAWAFDNDTNTGIYWHEADRLGITAGGTLSLLVDVGGLFTADGTSSLPAFTFLNDPNTGLYRIGADDIGIVAGGTHGLRIQSAWVRSIDATTGNFLINSDGAGTAASPTYSFVGDSNTGMYRAAADTLALVAGGTERMRIDTSGTYGRWFGPGQVTGAAIIRGEGTAANPTYTFYGDENTGLYRTGSDKIAFSLGGVEYMKIEGNNGVMLTGVDPYTTKQAWLTLNSPSTGGSYDDQVAGMSIGESGHKGSAALHIVYTGDGYGHIGMGTYTDGNDPGMAYHSLEFVYNAATMYHRSDAYATGWARYSNSTPGSVRLETSGSTYRVYQHTSSERWKTDMQVIEAAEAWDALDAVDAMTYQGTAPPIAKADKGRRYKKSGRRVPKGAKPKEENTEPIGIVYEEFIPPRSYGFSAEQMHAASKRKGTPKGELAAVDADGLPDSVGLEGPVSILWAALKDLKEKHDALEERLAALT